MKNKVIFLDNGIFMHRSIFAYSQSIKNYIKKGKSLEEAKVKSIKPIYLYFLMIISCLCKIGLNKDDIIILAVDSEKGSWRKKLDKEYKKSRKQKRDKEEYVDWYYWFDKFDKTISNISSWMPIVPIKVDYFEADDIIAFGVRYYKDKECIIVSYDQDFHQLLIYDNVKIFSPHPLAKKCPYKILDLNKNKEKEKAYGILSKKIIKEASDDLVKEIFNEYDFEVRKKIVSLIELPKEVEEVLLEVFKEIENEKLRYNINLFPYKKLKNRFLLAYTDKYKISYEDCVKKIKNKKSRRKK